MTKTSQDVVTYAYQHLGIAAEDHPITAEQSAIGKEILDGLFAEYAVEGFTTLTDVEAVPDAAFLGVGQMLAVELSGNRYGTPRNEQHWMMGLRRLRRLLMLDDRSDPADIDNDGTITADETQDDLEAQFF